MGLIPVAAAHAAPTGGASVPCHDNQALISAVNESNAAGFGTIRLAPGCIYTLTSAFPGAYGANALPTITGRVTIEGNRGTLARANTAPMMRILEVGGSGAVILRNATLTNGKLDPTFSFGGDVYVDNPSATLALYGSRLTGGMARWGGGVLNDGPLTIVRSKVTGNTSHEGGGIWDRWSLALSSSMVTDNAGDVGIGGIAVGGSTPGPTATATVQSSIVSDNPGGGLGNDVHTTLHLIDSVVNHNTSAAQLPGGGLHNEGVVTLTNTLVTGNRSANWGGGVYTTGQVALDRSVVAGNSAQTSGGGIYVGTGGAVTQQSSRVVGNQPDNCAPVSTVPGCRG